MSVTYDVVGNMEIMNCTDCQGISGTLMDVKYIIKPDEKIVVCIIEPQDPLKYVFLALNNKNVMGNNKKFGVNDVLYEAFDKTESKYFWRNGHYTAPSRYKGVAKCSENDTFNKVLGQQIAYARAFDKYTMALQKFGNRTMNMLTQSLTEIGKMITEDIVKKRNLIHKRVEFTNQQREFFEGE